jgi:Zn-dependent protease
MRFNILGIPVRVSPMFAVTALILWQIGRESSLESLAIWVLVMFSGVLFHEFGHAFAGRAYGLKPNVELHGMGGVTWWSNQVGLSPWRSIVVSVCGPLVGIVLGGLAYAYVGSMAEAPPELTRYALSSFIWVNLGWGLFNLVPVLPLDGGNILRSVCIMVSPHRGRDAADLLSTVVGVGLIGLSLMADQPMLAVFFGYFIWVTWKERKRRGERLAEAHLEPRFRKAVVALNARRFDEAEQMASSLVKEAESVAMKAAASGLMAWARFGSGDLEGAQTALDERPAGAPLDGGLQGALLLRQGEPEMALRHLEGAMQRSEDPQVPELLCVALIQVGRGAEVMALLESGAQGRMHKGASARLAAEARRSGDDTLADRILNG